jgi:hypothetical protein
MRAGSPSTKVTGLGVVIDGTYTMLLKYLLRTTVGGGLIGAAHGVATVHKLHQAAEPEQKILHVAAHAQVGAMIGPWLPVAAPLWLVLDGTGNRTECPVAKGGVPFRKSLFSDGIPPPQDQTIAEKP